MLYFDPQQIQIRSPRHHMFPFHHTNCLLRSCLIILLAAIMVYPAIAQSSPGSRNVTMVSRVSFEDDHPVPAEVEFDQEPARPFVYVARGAGFDVLGIENPAEPHVLHTWQADDVNQTARDVAYLKHEGRSYLAVALQHANGGVMLFDVTGLPDASTVQQVQRLAVPGGVHNLFAYKHSSGQPLLFAMGGGDVLVYELPGILAGTVEPVARIATPDQVTATTTGFHDVFAGYHPESQQDRLYGAGAGGYYVFDVTDLQQPPVLATISSAAVQRGHTIAPTPDGRYAVTSAGYRASPLRIFDLQPGLDGSLPRIRTAVGAWAADWRNHSENMELRWPYLFVASMEDGFQMVNLREPTAPYTVAYYDTYDGPPGQPDDPALHGAWDLDVRNTDGLIVVSDLDSGLWFFRVEGFESWDGRGWGVPNVSSAWE